MIFYHSLSFVPIKVMISFEFYKNLGLVSNEFVLYESFVIVRFLFKFVLSQFKFVTTLILLQFEFCPNYRIVKVAHLVITYIFLF